MTLQAERTRPTAPPLSMQTEPRRPSGGGAARQDTQVVARMTAGVASGRSRRPCPDVGDFARGDMGRLYDDRPTTIPRTGDQCLISAGINHDARRRTGRAPAQGTEKTTARDGVAQARSAHSGVADAPGGPGATGEVFGAIYQQHHRRISCLLRARLGDPDEAADLTQETFLRAYRAFGSFGRTGENVAAWLARIAANAACDQRRRGQHVAAVPWDAALEAPSAAPGDDPEAALLGAEDRRAV